MIGESLAAELSKTNNSAEERAAVKKCYTAMMTCSDDEVKKNLNDLICRLQNMREYQKFPDTLNKGSFHACLPTCIWVSVIVCDHDS